MIFFFLLLCFGFIKVFGTLTERELDMIAYKCEKEICLVGNNQMHHNCAETCIKAFENRILMHPHMNAKLKHELLDRKK